MGPQAHRTVRMAPVSRGRPRMHLWRPGQRRAPETSRALGGQCPAGGVHTRRAAHGSVAFAGRVSSPYVAIALFSVAGFAHQTLSVTVITMASDLFRRSEVATVAGMAGTLGNAGLLIFSLMIGWMVAKVGYSPFFVCLSILDIVGAIVLWTVVREHATT